MALTNSFSLVFLQILVLSLFSLCCARITSDQIATNDLISDVCKGTKNPSLCLEILRSHPQSQGADLHVLCEISILASQANAKAMVDMVRGLDEQATDPKSKELYSSCSDTYNDSLGDLTDANRYFNSGDYASVNIYASSAMDGVDTCDGNFGETLAEPPQIKEASQKLKDLCDMILVMSNRLR